MSSAPAPPAPPFCPNERCAFHRDPGPKWPWVRTGSFARSKPPLRVQRYQCRHCRRHFSEQTFRLGYWLKCPELLVPIFHHLVGGAAYRQAAREFGCSPQTVATHAARLGRHCQLFHERHRPHGPLAEPLVLDTFVSFEFSQYHPSGFHVAVGKRSHFFYGFTDSELRRSGRMTPAQKLKRARLEARHGRPDPRSTQKEVAALLGLVTAHSEALVLHTDEHTDYPRALKALRGIAVTHETISSRAARTAQNPLFAVNLLDMFIRHSGANHRRETIAFSKRRQGAAERMWCFLAWRNYVKSFSERKRDGSPAMRLGIEARRWTVPRMLERRLFPGRVALPQRWQRYYWRQVPTRMIPNARTHRLRYAV